MAYRYENRYIKYDLTPILRQNRISLMWNKDSEKSRSNSGTKFVPVKLYLVHRRSSEKCRHISTQSRCNDKLILVFFPGENPYVL